MIPDEHHVKPGQIALNIGWATYRTVAENHGDRLIQVGSHHHLAEVNPALKFDRQQATGYRLSIPASTAVCFEPGQKREAKPVVFAGHRAVFGFRGETMGPLGASDE